MRTWLYRSRFLDLDSVLLSMCYLMYFTLLFAYNLYIRQLGSNGYEVAAETRHSYE